MKNIFSRTIAVQKYFDIETPKDIFIPKEEEVRIRAQIDVDLSRSKELHKIGGNRPLTDNEKAELGEINARLAQASKEYKEIYESALYGKKLAQQRLAETKDQVAIEIVKKDEESLKVGINSKKQDVAQTTRDQQAKMSVGMELENEKLVTNPVQTKNALENFEKTKNNTIVARLFGLPDNFFKTEGFGSIKDIKSLQSMMVAVKHVVDTGMDIPTSRKEWEAIGYNIQGIVFQKTEAALLTKFANHIKSNPEYRTILNYVVAYADNNRDGYIATIHDKQSSRLANMAKKEATTMNIVDGKLEATQENIVRALVGNKDSNYSSIGIVDLQGSLTRAIKQGQKIEDIYQRITGRPLDKTDLGIMEARVQFRDALEMHIALIRAVTGNSNAGLDALLQDKQGSYIEAIRQRIQKGEVIEIKSIDKKGFNNNAKNILSGLFGVGVAVVSAGKITLNAYHGREMTAERVMQSIDGNKEFAEKLNHVVGGLANFVLGRNLKLSIGHDDFLKAFEARIKTQAEEVMALTLTTDSKIIRTPGLQAAFETAKRGGYLNSPEDLKKFQELVITRIIDAEARGVTDYKAIWASINPVFFGVHYDRIHSKKTETKASEANVIEGRITANDIQLDKIDGVEVSADNKVFKFSQTLKDLTGAYNGDIPVLMKNANDELAPVAPVVTHDVAKKLHLTIVTNQGNVFYIAEFIDKPKDEPRAEQSAEVSEKTIVGEIAMTAQAENLIVSREVVREGTRSNIGESIYQMTRNPKYNNFNDALDKIGNQDYQGALLLLEKGKTNTEKTLYKQFKDKNPEELAVLLTFKYGHINRDYRGNLKEQDYLKAHPDKVRVAENKLTTYNKTTKEMDNIFLKHSPHIPTELMNMGELKGQTLAVSVYATPLNGRHRIDKFSGSITVSNKMIDIVSADAKAEIFDRHTRDNQRALDSINNHLVQVGKTGISMNEFRDWMVKGKLPNGITEDMIQKHSGPKFLETRAMIQGNLCANKTEVIAYPLLVSQPQVTPPKVELNGLSVGSTTVLMESAVNMVNSDLGVNPVAFTSTRTPDSASHKPNSTVRDGNQTNILPNSDMVSSNGSNISSIPVAGNTVNAGTLH